MTVIKINALTVPADTGDEVAKRFAARAGAVDNAEGFEGFELLRPTDSRSTWLVVTRWANEEAFESWKSSQEFAHGHRSAASDGDNPERKPLAIESEIWSYEPTVSSAGAASS